MPKRGQTCKCGRHTWNGKRWELITPSPKDYIEKLLGDVDGQREAVEEARLIDLLLDGRLENLIQAALEEIRND